MSRQDSSSRQKGWKSAEFKMTTSPSVGRFSNDQKATLYVKGSSAKFDENDGRKTMAPCSNHGQLSQQASQQPASDIVDLRTATSANCKTCGLCKLGCIKEVAIGHDAYETSETDSYEPEELLLVD